MKLVVVAGGQGTKLWPLSREKKPKQFQKVIGSKTLFSYTVDTLLTAFDPEDIIISTKELYLKNARTQAPKIPQKNYIVEPNAKVGRGPGEGLAFLTLSIKHEDEPFVVIQSDNIRSPEDKFIEMLFDMEKLVKKSGKFISGGIKATYPIIGVDYLKLGERVKTEINQEVYKVEEYIERSEDYFKTKKLLENFHITTHCNHNCWYPNLMLNAYKKYRPDWYKNLMNIRKVLNDKRKVEGIYSKMRPGATEDVTKHLFSKGYIVLVPYNWADLGTWSSVYEYFSKDGGVYKDGNVIVAESKNTVVKNAVKGKITAVLGVDNLIIVDTKDALLVIPKNRSGDIKKILKELRKKKLNKYL